MIKSLNQGDQLYLKIWKIEVDFEKLETTERSETFSLTELENGYVRFMLGEKNTEVFNPTSNSTMQITFFTGESVSPASTGQFLTGARYNENGHNYIVGEYNYSGFISTVN